MMAGTRGRRETGQPSLPRLVAQALREQAPQRYFMREHYGPDGEIAEVWEGHPIELGDHGVQAVIVTGTDYAKPRRDWRERGVVPPEGFHASRWRTEG